MPSLIYRHVLLAIVLITTIVTFYDFVYPSYKHNIFKGLKKPHPSFRWKDIKPRFPPQKIRSLPSSSPKTIPQVQFDFPPESSAERRVREQRLRAVKDTFIHSWTGYKEHAWLQDEVGPLSGTSNNGFGGWGATLVDSLDTLWIMEMKEDFHQAVKALDYIDFTSCPNDRISVFETNIRYLGGLLSAYDLSGRRYKKILTKAIEVGDMLYAAFDTPNRMPITQWFWERASKGAEQTTPTSVLLAEYGSFSMEFTRLSQITRDPKYYDAIARLTDLFEKEQNRTNVPGLWPISLKAKTEDFTADTHFTFGSMADSMYEYLPKQWLLLNGRVDSYKTMYASAMRAAKENLFFRPISPNSSDILFSGSVQGYARDSIHIESEMQHLTCFVGGMVALGARLFPDTPEHDRDMDLASQLTNGCVWAYASMPSGIMPELFTPQRCKSSTSLLLQSPDQKPDPACAYTEEKWHAALRDTDWRHHIVPPPNEDGTPQESDEEEETDEQHAQRLIRHRHLTPGVVSIRDPRYLLRPEAIESVFVLWRTTGDRVWLERGWEMFLAIRKHTKTDIAHAAVKDVRMGGEGGEAVELEDKMESFWLGETLKYFYLLFAETDVVSLDTFVLNTEAHPLLWRGQ